MSEQALREAIVKWGASIFSRGLTSGSSGNISVRIDECYLATPTNSCLGFLDPARLSRLDASGAHIGGDRPTKELPLHFAFYENRPDAQAVVHLHSSFATALSCLTDIDAANAIPPLTPYVAMRVGKVPVVPYARPGSSELAVPIARLASKHVAVVIQNHGPVVCGRTLDDAVYAIEELEEAAKLALLTRGLPVRVLAPEALAELERHFKLK
jgi:ribulose-5-phosphate 4-epimerase/fuculose-1-phosphate aldolase